MIVQSVLSFCVAHEQLERKMKIADITHLGEGVYELEKGDGDRKPDHEDLSLAVS